MNDTLLRDALRWMPTATPESLALALAPPPIDVMDAPPPIDVMDAPPPPRTTTPKHDNTAIVRPGLIGALNTAFWGTSNPDDNYKATVRTARTVRAAFWGGWYTVTLGLLVEGARAALDRD